MATSGVKTFDLDFASCVEEAYDRCGASGTTAYSVRSARRSANLLLQSWQNKGYNLWTVEEQTIATQSAATYYELDEDTVDVLEVVYRIEGKDRPLERKSITDYARLNDKTMAGEPTQFYVMRQRTPRMYVWPVLPTAEGSIVLWRMRRMDDAPVSGNQTFDMPTRLLPAFVAGLAYYLSLKVPEAASRVASLKAVYDEEWDMATHEDRDRSSLIIEPEY